MTEKTPVEVRNDHDNARLVIKYDDGDRLMFPYDDLRNKCPCAGCRGHSPGEVEPPDVKGAQLRHIAEVGNYALRLTWADGHDTGIYTWSYLLEIGQPMIA